MVSNRGTVAELFSSIAVDYIKTVSLLCNLNLMNSKLIDETEFPDDMKSILSKSTPKKLYELMCLYDLLIHFDKHFYSNDVSYQKKIYMLDCAVFMSDASGEKNEFFEVIFSHYPSTLKIVQLELAYHSNLYSSENYSNGINTANYEADRVELKNLVQESDYRTFIKKYSFLSKDTLEQKLSDMYLHFFNGEQHLSVPDAGRNYILDVNNNVLTYFGYVHDNTITANSDFSQFAYLAQYGKKEHSDAELKNIKNIANYSNFERVFSYATQELKNNFHGYLAREDFSNIVKEQKQVTEMFNLINESDGINVSSTESLLCLNYLLGIKEQLNKQKKAIKKELYRILSDDKVSIGLKLLEVELYMKSILIRQLGGNKLFAGSEAGKEFYVSITKVYNSFIAEAFNDIKKIAPSVKAK